MSLAETAARDARIVTLQARLLDYTGHVTPGLPRAEALALVEEINALRVANGWRPLNMEGRWRRQKSPRKSSPRT
jgi:hypothetical protein